MNLKIDDIITYFCGTFAFLEVTTNKGYNGVGECVCGDRRIFEATINKLKSLIIGKNPIRTEQLWREMYGSIFFYMTPSVLSAIDIALWDIKGKVFGVPVYELLGGLFHQHLRLYTHVRGAWNSYPDETKENVFYEPWGTQNFSPKELSKNALDLVKKGYTCIKFDPFKPSDNSSWPSYKTSEIDQAIEVVEAIRCEVGRDIDILIEAHCKFDSATAIRIGKQLEKYNVMWFEDPVPQGHLQSLIKVSKHLNLPIAAGERLFYKSEYNEYLQSGAIDIVMSDIGKIGGITEMSKVSTLAEVYKVGFSPHNPFGPVAAIAAAHVCSSSPAFLIQEYEDFVPWAIQQKIQIKDGYLYLSDNPGLGISLNKEKIAQIDKQVQNGSLKGPDNWIREKFAPAF